MKKKYIAIALIVLGLAAALCGCAWNRKNHNLTPSYKAVSGIVIQKTYTDADGKVTYKEKKIEAQNDITSIMDKLNAVAVDRQAAVEYDHVDFLVLFEGNKQHRLLVFDKYFIYDGTAYLPTNEKQINVVSDLYDKLNYEETEATSRLFQ